MSSCDFFIPDPPIRCPVCDAELTEWRGYEYDACYFVWRQAQAHPVEQRIDPEIRLRPDDLRKLRLPESFVIQSDDCDCPYAVCAYCYTTDRVWTRSEVVTAENARQWKEERRKAFRRRMRWLKGGSPGSRKR